MLTDDGLSVSRCLVEGGHIGVIYPEIAFWLVIMAVDASHDGVVEITVTLAEGVDSEVVIEEVPGKQTHIFLVFEVDVAIKDSDSAIRLQLVNLERVLMIDIIEVDVNRVAIEHVGDDIFVVNDLLKMIYEVLSVTLFESADLAYHVIGEFDEHTSIFRVRLANTL
jgi:hypothetical protein